MIAQVNQQLPYMGNDAEVEPSNFDFVIDHPRYSSALFSVPKTPVSVADHAIGLRVSTLVRDGGSLQIGIGTLGDAVSHALALRDDLLAVAPHHGHVVRRQRGDGQRGRSGAQRLDQAARFALRDPVGAEDGERQQRRQRQRQKQQADPAAHGAHQQVT